MHDGLRIAARFEQAQAQIDDALVELVAFVQRFPTPIATAATLKLAALLASTSRGITTEHFVNAARRRFENAVAITTATRECAAGGTPCPLHSGQAPGQRVH